MFIAATIALVVAFFIGIIRAFIGPTIYDRILAVNKIGTLTVLLISVHGFLMGRPEFLDLAIVYALINFISTIAILKYMRFKSLSPNSNRTKPVKEEN